MIQKVTREQLLPPACSFLSRTDKDPWFIDTGYFEDYYGNVYIGKADFEELAKVAGYEPIENGSALRMEIEELKRDLASANAKLTEFEHLRDAVRSFSKAERASKVSTGSSRSRAADVDESHSEPSE